MTCIHTFISHLWWNAEGEEPNLYRALDYHDSAWKMEGTPQFEQYRPVVHSLLERLSAVWRVLIRTEVDAPGENFLNWDPSYSKLYAEIALVQARLHMLYL